MEHEPIETPQKRGQGFAGAGGSEDEGAFSPGNYRPTLALRCRGLIEDSFEPLRRHRMKASEWIGFAGRLGRGEGHLLL